ncbi:MAG: hypothetical protein M3Q96_00775 [Pseudomonadota bacterium]|nr:hypothetical protein [Pseudomonadota bacterium]MDQ3229990.1 hypothetical protein [Pseudomonadota bacterium]
MRQMFTSPRLENVERVAQLLNEAGIETKISNGRSYKGSHRGGFSYREDERTAPQPAVWVLISEDQPRARQILRDAGLLETTRAPADSYLAPTFRAPEIKTPESAQKRALQLKLGFLIAIVMIIGLVFIQVFPDSVKRNAPAAVVTTPQAIGDTAAMPTPEALAVLILNSESSMRAPAVLCVAVDGRDASEGLMTQIRRPSRKVVPASQCVRVANAASGSYHRPSGAKAFLLDISGFRQSADTAQVRFNAFHSTQAATSKTLEVRNADGRWEIVQLLRHVEF